MKPGTQGLLISSEQNAPSESLTSPAVESERLRRHASSAQSPQGETPASPGCSAGPTLTRCQHIDHSTCVLNSGTPPTLEEFMPAETCQLQQNQKNPRCHLQTYCGPFVPFRTGAQQRIWPQPHREDLLKSNDNQIGCKQEPCRWSLRMKTGNTLEPPPPWEGTAALGSHHATALSDEESLTLMLQRELTRAEALPVTLASSPHDQHLPCLAGDSNLFQLKLTDSVCANTHFLALLLTSKTLSKKR